ncbi:BlaI/MecI/CopY family transcriptional regulator [Pseudoalteromonas sp. MMG005]|uniref:BlaI/MecI/CopY family transcriptional regulator n=1 Tax=Pseudoalteromonas sp. MMG005 TaxID=2822682 RepID=UPI001B3A7138|nr:BlaI/MecI/CopY family transcriptional regulator [Pseudoalteromonas sp. MMG005]MBQ4847839.1 BlaI/MecI/CopY family transcriptional regulator [Pseudoalteromonas sp. MMG005]
MIELSKAEFAVMEALWAGYPAKASDIIKRLSDDTQWHEKTIKTLVGRLVKKNAITFEKQGREYIYTPTIERDEYTHKESSSFIQRLFQGRIAPLVSGFAKTQQLSQRDIDELKQVIDKWEQEQGKGK